MGMSVLPSRVTGAGASLSIYNGWQWGSGSKNHIGVVVGKPLVALLVVQLVGTAALIYQCSEIVLVGLRRHRVDRLEVAQDHGVEAVVVGPVRATLPECSEPWVV